MLFQACYSTCADGKSYHSEEALMRIMYLNKIYIYIFVYYIYMLQNCCALPGVLILL